MTKKIVGLTILLITINSQTMELEKKSMTNDERQRAYAKALTLGRKNNQHDLQIAMGILHTLLLNVKKDSNEAVKYNRKETEIQNKLSLLDGKAVKTITATEEMKEIKTEKKEEKFDQSTPQKETEVDWEIIDDEPLSPTPWETIPQEV